MTNEQREKIFKEIWDFCKSTWKTKGRVYSTKEDVLSNFKISAERRNISPEKSLLILTDKHSIAIDNYINKKHLTQKEKEDMIDKVKDNINYYGLLLCLIKEEKPETKVKIYS